MTTMSRRHLATLLCALLGCGIVSGQSVPAGYPNKTIRMIVPLAAGSAVDNAASPAAVPVRGSSSLRMAMASTP